MVWGSEQECARRYTTFYDGVVSTLQRDHADLGLRYHGIALALPLVAGTEVFWTYFLDRRNHNPTTIPLDYISYHWCKRQRLRQTSAGVV